MRPRLDPQARGLIAGLTLRHGRGHLYRTLLEATAYGVRHVLEVMRGVGGEIGRLVAARGGTKGGLWTHIVSDVVGLPQQIPEKTIGASYGDAFLAALASGRQVGLPYAEGQPSRMVASQHAVKQLAEL